MTAPSFAAKPTDYTRLLPASDGSVLDLAALKDLLAVRRDEIAAHQATADSGMDATAKRAAAVARLLPAPASAPPATSHRRDPGIEDIGEAGIVRWRFDVPGPVA